jgi:hypothetical protein
MLVEDSFPSDPYSLTQKAKEHLLLTQLQSLTQYHYSHCTAYRKLLHYLYNDNTSFSDILSIPYLPVSLFKTQRLYSIADEAIFKILQSSGTTGSQPSLIFLDQATAQRQSLALANIMTAFLGPQRLPMLVLDHPNVIRDRHSYSARGAALVGMLSFGRDVCYAFDETMTLQHDHVLAWLDKYKTQPVLLFGMTFVIWNYWLSLLSDNTLDIPQGILMHTGGWKRMQTDAVSPALFQERLYRTTGISRCHNFYGMVEQVGSVFVACEQGYFHCPQFADIIVRTPSQWKAAASGEIGVLQSLSILPTSYPGHSLLTEDLGMLIGVDDCQCGRHGKYFEVLGRVPKAEIRGCSDTFTV